MTDLDDTKARARQLAKKTVGQVFDNAFDAHWDNVVENLGTLGMNFETPENRVVVEHYVVNSLVSAMIGPDFKRVVEMLKVLHKPKQ